MPRKKKTDQSPARVPGRTPETGSLDRDTGHRGTREFDSVMAENFPSITPMSDSVKERIIKDTQEIFSHLDPEVIYIVLSECDFKVENAMDPLLELSVAAEGAAPGPTPISGFDRSVSALLGSERFSGSRSNPDSNDYPLPPCSPSTDPLGEELELLVDQELETLNMQQERCSSQPSSSLPPPFTANQVLPELLQSSLQPGSRGSPGSQVGQTFGTSSPVDLHTGKDKNVKAQKSLVDFTEIVEEAPTNSPKPPLDLGASGRPSAFQVYKKQQSLQTNSPNAATDSNAVVGGARAKVSLLTQEPCGSLLSPWNIDAPVFTPYASQNQGPAFITPVAQLPSSLTSQPWPSVLWLDHMPISQAPLRPCATIPKSWVPSALQSPPHQNRLRLQGRVLVLLRGAPGSGKSTLAKALKEHNPSAVILSTDDYFTSTGYYQFDPSALGEAHEWNHKRAKEAFERGSNPIIIDNTNLQSWEMRPYVVQAVKHGYKVLFREPDTWWRYKPRELVRRTTHDVPLETIRHMLDKYERIVSIQSILGPQIDFKQSHLLENECFKLPSSETHCPDIIGQPERSHPHLFLPLPDVSSIGHKREMGTVGAGTSMESEVVHFQPTGAAAECLETPQMGKEIDSDDVTGMDSQVELNHLTMGQTIPDCIVESVMNEDHQDDEVPVAFCETIGQRVRRERAGRRSCFDNLEPADLVKDANQSDRNTGDREKTKAQEDTQTRELLRPEGEIARMDFEGDWPSEGFLEQRQVRRRERRIEKNRKMDEAASQKSDETPNGPEPEANITEFQKLLDLLQTGVADISMDSFTRPSLLSSSEEESEPDKGADRCCSSSNSDERGQNMAANRNYRELPDFVLDQKMSDSGNTMVALMDDWGVLKTENERKIMKVVNNEIGSPSLIPANANPLLADNNLLIPSETLDPNVRRDGDTEPASTLADVDSSKCTLSRLGADESQNNKLCPSPVCQSSVRAENTSYFGASQERKQRQGRRSGKQCKLALTFTQNCSSPSIDSFGGSVTINSCNETSNTHAENESSEWSTSLEPNSDLSIQSSSVAQPHVPSSLMPVGVSSQTEPQDFAFLWRLSNQNHLEEGFIATYSQRHNITVLSGSICRFQLSTPGPPAIHAHNHKEVPYRVVHDKSTQVEDKELGVIQGRFESLRILSRHFKLVSFDTLEDLYDKCHQDLEWTTNLLLDSGEIFFKEEDGYQKTKHSTEDKGNEMKPVVENPHPDGIEKQPPESRPVEFEDKTEANQRSWNASGGHLESTVMDRDQTEISETSSLSEASQTEHQATNPGERCTVHEQEADQDSGAWGGKQDDGLIIEAAIENTEELASMEAVDALLQAELSRIEKEEKQNETEIPGRRPVGAGRSEHLDIQTVELKLPTEVALQLIELFGPVGVDPDSTDDCAVQMDLNLSKLIHQKWKESIQEKQRHSTLSFLSYNNVTSNWGEPDRPGPPLPDGHPEGHSHMPFMDHWNVSHPHISLRDIMEEQQALQDNMEKKRRSLADLDRRDGASLLNENQLYSLFPSIDRHFLLDIFRDHNYNLTHTELFLRSLLDEEPIKTVVAPQAPLTDHYTANSKERELKQKPAAPTKPEYQDTVDPEYEDFRAEASLQRSKQLESLAKAAEAFKQGRREVASFYAQQGQVHGQLKREANDRAAVHIFERVNSSLLPRNILDLHGLHVNEAINHLVQVLQDKTTAYEKGLCRPQLSVITGRGNHSQGGVARIHPAVIKYLTNAHYRPFRCT